MSFLQRHLPRNYVPFVDVTEAPKSATLNVGEFREYGRLLERGFERLQKAVGTRLPRSSSNGRLACRGVVSLRPRDGRR